MSFTVFVLVQTQEQKIVKGSTAASTENYRKKIDKSMDTGETLRLNGHEQPVPLDHPKEE